MRFVGVKMQPTIVAVPHRANRVASLNSHEREVSLAQASADRQASRTGADDERLDRRSAGSVF
jgi:hypothetical protein